MPAGDLQKLMERVEFLELRLRDLERDARLAIEYAASDPEGAVGKAGRGLEAILQALHGEKTGKSGRGQTIEQLRAALGASIPINIQYHVEIVQRFRNIGVHARETPLSSSDVMAVLHAFLCVVEWWADLEKGGPTSDSAMRESRNAMSRTGASATVSGARPRAHRRPFRLWPLIVAVALLTAAAAVWWFTARPTDRVAATRMPTFTRFETEGEERWVIPGDPSATLTLVGQHLNEATDVWLPAWCRALRDEGLATDCDVYDLAEDGTSLALHVVVPEHFERPDLPLPATTVPRRAPIALRFRLRIAIVHYGGQSHYEDLIDTLVKAIQASDRQFEPRPRIDRFDQNDLGRLLDALRHERRWDLVRLPPLAYVRARRILLDARPDDAKRPEHEPIRMLACGETREQSATYQSVLIARKGHFKTGELPRDAGDLQREIEAMRAAGKSVTFFWGNQNSTSGFVIPCIDWGPFVSRPELGIGSTRIGDTKSVVSVVLDEKARDVRLGFGYDAPVKRYAGDKSVPFDVLWGSRVLPLGGIGMLTDTIAPRKQAVLDAHMQRVLDAFADGSLSTKPGSDVDTYGRCLPDMYRDLVEYLESLDRATREKCNVDGFTRPDTFR